jgi:hypothetical protein
MSHFQLNRIIKKPASLKKTCRFLVLGLTALSLNAVICVFIDNYLYGRSSVNTQITALEIISVNPLTIHRKAHDFHTSLTEMRYNIKSKTFEISLRIFTDDLEKVLSVTHQNKKFLVENNDKNDSFVEAYIKKHFVVINPKNQRTIINYIGKEKEGEATWIYLEMPVNESLKGSKIQNVVLIDMFEDQTNIVNIFVNNDKKSYLFTVKNKAFVVEI